MKDSVSDPEKKFLITDISGYTPEISRLICMMEYARSITLHSVKGMTVEDLDHRFDERSNSIGALLTHIAADEYYYQVFTSEKRDLTEEERSKWKAAFELGESARKEIKENDLDHYLRVLNDVREDTLKIFKTKNDEWLYEEVPFWQGKQSNNYFMWFHVFEDEINHRGQINWLKKRILK